MSEEESPNGKKKGFSSLLLSNFHSFCSFILSHPFYFTYLLFFSPYIFKILSFLSPLFVTTTLLLLALISTLHGHDTESLETQPSFLVSFCTKLDSALEPKFEELEAYKKVVEGCSMECASENENAEIKFVDKFCSHESTHEEPIEIQPLKFEDPMDHLVKEEEEIDKCEKEGEEEEEHKVKPKSVLVLDNGEPTKQESKAQKVEFVGEVKEEEEEDVGLKSFGSMRKEKEWRRTLACKLFEERHNSNVGQGMDQLWETYETETEKKQTEEEKRKEKKMMMKKKKKEVVVEEEEDEDGIDQQQLCCLQALKFSTGKMHLGIARPNLLKLSKAFKGFGRLYNATKHSKKP